ncbi:MAG: hypothetical protein C0459_09460 [Chitinophaga sp.]|jgi:hypothetical protein|nr:hypothetical protein [Chitinophaga sp.]
MRAKQTQFITDDKGNKLSAVLPIKQYEQLLAELEEVEDIKLYDAVKKRNEPIISFDTYLKQRAKK